MSSTQNPKLHAYLATQGLASRRKVEELIAEGKISVNDQVAHLGQRVDPTTDRITVNGSPFQPTNQAKIKMLVYKPVGYISTTSDELGRKTVLNLIPKQSQRLYPVGRLDKESEGLMLLTNDGELAQRLTHPSYNQEKTYYVQLDRDASPAAIEHLRRGVKLGQQYIHPRLVEVLPPETFDDLGFWLAITITEGINHEVRRMIERIGYQVQRLIRVKIGEFSLEQLEGKPFKIVT